MNTLQTIFERVLTDAPRQMLVGLIAGKLEQAGVRLTARERSRLAEKIDLADPATLRELHFRSWKWWEQSRHVLVDITEDDFRRMQEGFDRVLSNLPELIESSLDNLCGRVLLELYRRWPSEARAQAREMSRFTKRLADQWKRPLGLLAMILAVSQELGSNANAALRETASPDEPYLIESLTRLHARACQISAEVLSLLRGGFADGAMARWRTLHEIAVISFFVAEHGEGVAEQYVLHQVCESYRAALEYRKFEQRLGADPFPGEELESLRRSRDELVGRFGHAYYGKNGWAASALKIQDPTFANIESATKIDHLRPYYRMASHNVHANPKGVFFKLGLLQENEVLLAGPSDAGLADPGEMTAISLNQVTVALLGLRPTLDNLAGLRTMGRLVQECITAFADVQSAHSSDKGSA